MNRFRTLVIAASAIVFAHCGDNPVDTSAPVNFQAADSVASFYFQSLGDTLATLGDKSTEELRNLRFDDLRDGFEDALQEDRNNAIAHLGLSILEILELNYDEEIWALVDSIDAWQGGGTVSPPPPLSRHNTLVGRQFSMLVQVPFFVAIRTASTFPPNVTLHNIQTIISDKVMPSLSRSIDHLRITEGRTATEIRILIDSNGVQEYILIDMGEILLWDASIHALRTAFGIAVAYDVDLFGPDGTYDWIDDRRASDDSTSYCPIFQLIELGATDDLNLIYDFGGRTSAEIDSLDLLIAYHNLEIRTSFLSLRDNGESLDGAHADLNTTLDKLDAAAAFIRARDNTSEESVIKLTDLTDLDSDLATNTNKPNFAQNFDTVEDVIQFVRALFSGPMDFNEELGSLNTPYAWTMDLSVLFDDPVGDWNSLLPYHRWNIPSGNWITSSTILVDESNYGGSSFSVYVWNGSFCEYMTFNSIGYVRSYSRSYDIDTDTILELLDGSNGNVIDLDLVRVPYFPDYTFNGIFPQMDRSGWLELELILR